HDPGYEEGHTKPNVPVEVPQTKDPNVPPGTTFEIPPAGIPEGWTAEVDPDDGTVTVTPPADATPGTSVDIPVKVTYPDGSSEETPVKVTVDTPDSGNHDPGYEEGHTKPNVPVEVPQTKDPNVPPGTTFEIPPAGIPEGWTAEVDPDNGTVTVTPPADATPGTSVDIPVKVTYPDGSSEETPVKVTVDTPDSGNHDPGYEEGHTKPNVPVEVPQTKDPNVPPGTTFEIPPAGIPEGWTAEVDPDDGTVTVTPPADATPGTSVDIPVKVTYPDGSIDEITTRIVVEQDETDADADADAVADAGDAY
ncbi:YPDG domain-containing protein, partial [Staphylococcus pseudintermedius]|uniref:YPDG domain-containing protein n=1 Tax=Staphylococcus pseudintermedius TaxID=283734 RepID=UPI000D81414C